MKVTQATTLVTLSVLLLLPAGMRPAAAPDWGLAIGDSANRCRSG